MNEILSFWARFFAIVGGIFLVVGGSFLALSPFMGPKTIGYLWCGFMFLGIIVVGSWWIYDDQRFSKRLRIERSLYIIIDYYSAHLQ